VLRVLQVSSHLELVQELVATEEILFLVQFVQMGVVEVAVLAVTGEMAGRAAEQGVVGPTVVILSKRLVVSETTVETMQA
jgi:hypothetical protein